MAEKLSEETRALVRSRIPNYENLTPDEQADEAIKVMAKDFNIYRERNLMIQDKVSSQIIPFELNWAQKLLVDIVLKDLEAGVPVRYIVLKARQMGLSTIIEALCYWWTTTHRHARSLIMAHESTSAETLYEMFRRYYDFSNSMFQPDKKYNTRKDIVFDVEDNVKAEWKKHIDACESPESCGVSHKPLGLDSSIKTMVAKDGKGRSLMITFFHGSEVAFWEVKADVVSSAIQAIPMAANTFGFLESTANGVGGYFYDEWQNAVTGEGAFRPLFFAWHEHSEYELPCTMSLTDYTEEELKLFDIFREKGYDRDSWDRKVLWRRAKKKEFRYDPKKFYQEYPATDMEAFLASGRPVFDLEILRKMEQYAKKHSNHRFGQIVPDGTNIGSKNYVFEEIATISEGSDPSPLKVWDLPEPGEKFVIGVDVSEGKIEQTTTGKENDYSVIDVTRVRDLKTVARWRGHIDPDLLGGVTYAIGTFYNTALVAVEINNHGLTVVQSLRNKFYRNLYKRETSEENQFQERTALMGWRTDRKTKKVIINNLVHAIRDSDILDLDILFIRECMTYVKDDQGFTNAQEGRFDDTVMAKAIALKMTDFDEMDSATLRDNISKPIKRNKNASNTNANNELDSIANPTGIRPSHSNSEAVARRRDARARHRRGR